MDLNKKIDLIESLGDCKEYFLIGKNKDTDEYIYSCTQINEALDLVHALESIAYGIRQSIENELLNTDAIDDLLNDFDINKNEN